MVSKSLVALTAALATVWAQSTTDAPSATVQESATGTASSAEKTHTINVGASGHKFTPAEVEADVGDIIEWRFYPSNHWVIQGDYDYPCIPYEYAGLDRTGFSSEMQKVQAITNDGPRFRVRVNDTDPFFFYCGAPGSCVKYKMMGVVNPSKNETLAGYLKNAEGVDRQLVPGDPWPTEEGFPEPSSTSGSSSDEPSDDDNNSSGGHKKSLSTGAIAGIAVGGAAVLLLAGALLYLCGRRGGFDKAYRKSFRNSAPPPPPVVEQSIYSPHPSVADPWAAQKSPGLMASHYGQQSPPMSPHQSLAYGTHPGMVDGTPGSYYDYQKPQMGASPSTTPKPAEPIAPVELPGSPDPGHSPAPTYNTNNNVNNDGRTFSWHGDEQGHYRPAN
ncbi:hypothetical protein FGRMN_1860 [Fusarium graminum]|nr:hypothetical protein FGRMN_1860 [Fusarium graminum]